MTYFVGESDNGSWIQAPSIDDAIAEAFDRCSAVSFPVGHALAMVPVVLDGCIVARCDAVVQKDDDGKYWDTAVKIIPYFRVDGGTDDSIGPWFSTIREAMCDWINSPVVSDGPAWDRLCDSIGDEDVPETEEQAVQYMAEVVSAYAAIDGDHAKEVTLNGIITPSGYIEYRITRREGT